MPLIRSDQQRDLDRVRQYMAANRDISVSNYLRWGLSRASAEERADREYAQSVQVFEAQRVGL